MEKPVSCSGGTVKLHNRRVSVGRLVGGDRDARVWVKLTRLIDRKTRDISVVEFTLTEEARWALHDLLEVVPEPWWAGAKGEPN